MSEHTQHAQTFSDSIAIGTAKAAPPVVATGLTVMGVQLQDWLIILTIIYTLMQIFISLPKICDTIRSWRK